MPFQLTMKSNYSDSKEKIQNHYDLPSDMVRIPAGTFTMESDHHYPEESPSHKITVDFG
jgi:formylglycine-generating enzyme required for sulfatase activity